MSGRVVVCFAIAAACAGPAFGQTPADSLVVTGRLESAGTIAGGGGGVQWLHTLAPDSGMELGIFTGSLADNTLSYTRLGAYRKWRMLAVSGGADLGRSTTPGTRLSYRAYRGGAGFHALPRVVLEGEVQSVHLKGSPAQLVVRSGASWHALNRADVQVALYSLTSNGTTSHSVGARADIALNRVTLIGGTVLGVHGFELGGTGILMTTPTEYFGGWKVKTGRVDVLGVFDLTGSAVRVTRTMIGVQIPLRTATTP